MFIFDFTDHLLDQIFYGHQAIRSAIFINHQSHMNAVRLHLCKQHTDWHRGWHEQQGAQHGFQGQTSTGAVEPMLKCDIFQMRKSERRIQGAIVNRQSGQARVTKHIYKIFFCDCHWHRFDVSLRHHHIFNAQLPQIPNARCDLFTLRPNIGRCVLIRNLS